MTKKQSVMVVVLIMASALAGALSLRGIARAQSSSSRPPQQVSAAPDATQQKWEYMLISGTPRQVDKELKDAGATPWEVVGLTATEVEGGKQNVVVILRHSKP